ncbi:MAG: hypothetical protein ACJAVI_001334 [Candidatus Azotimanducaceae bacterium]|jgi:hypothetical protein
MKYVVIVVLLSMISSCSSNPYDHWHGPLQSIGLRDRTVLERSSSWALSKESKIYVVMANNDLLNQEVHQNLVRAVQRYFPAASAGAHREDLSESLDTAVLHEQDFLLYPQIWQSQDRVGWNKLLKKDIEITDIQQAEFKIDLALYSVQPGMNARIAGNKSSLKSVDSIQFQSAGSIFTHSGNEMLWSSLDAYLRHLSQY